MKIVMIVLCLVFVLHLSSTIINIPDDYLTIQEGINASVDTDTVLVQSGTYVENINFNGKNITVASLFYTTQDTSYISQTIIDGNQNGSVVTFESGEDSTAVLSGFTITNGGDTVFGGGIRCVVSNPKLINLIISNNSAGANGGGICCAESSPSLDNVIIMNNSAGWGGGVMVHNSNSSFQNVVIIGNFAWYSGGGIDIYTCNPGLENVLIAGNQAVDKGGGIFIELLCNPNLVNVLITDNSAEYGGGIFSWISNSNLINVTLSNNSADFGGGIYCRDANPNLVNCILWNDLPEETYFDESSGPNSITISYSDIQGGESGIVTNNNGTVNWLEGNIDEDPFFLFSGDDPYQLTELSPCIDTGTPDTTGLNLPEFDLAGNPRIYGDTIDMGAYEWQGTGVGNYELPIAYYQLTNFPNPFNPTTTISFSILEESKIELSIFNIKGQKIKSLLNDQITAGEHSIIWNGEDASGKKVSSGVYLYKLNVNGKTEAVKKCLLVK